MSNLLRYWGYIIFAVNVKYENVKLIERHSNTYNNVKSSFFVELLQALYHCPSFKIAIKSRYNILCKNANF